MPFPLEQSPNGTYFGLAPCSLVAPSCLYLPQWTGGKKLKGFQLSECKNQYPGTNFIAYHAEIHNFITLWHDGSFNLFALGQKSDQSHINTLQHIKETFSHSPPDKANCKIFHHPGIYKEALITKNCTSSMSDTRRVFSVAWSVRQREKNAYKHSKYVQQYQTCYNF